MLELADDIVLRRIGPDFLIRRGRSLFRTNERGFGILSRAEKAPIGDVGEVPAPDRAFCQKAADLGILVPRG